MLSQNILHHLIQLLLRLFPGTAVVYDLTADIPELLVGILTGDHGQTTLLSCLLYTSRCV